MNILMVSDVYFPRVNGVSTSIQTFQRQLAAQGVSLRLVVPEYQQEIAKSACEPWCIRIPSRKIPFDPEDRAMDSAALEAVLQQEIPKAHLVHIQTPFFAHYAAVKIARQHRVPVVATYHTFFEEYLYHYIPLIPKSWLKGLARRISRQQCNALDHVVVPSRAMRDRLAAYGVTTPMTVLPTGIPLHAFAQGDGAAFRAEHGIAPDRPVALFVGRVAHEKNIDFLLEVIARVRHDHPGILLLIAGEGPALNELQRQVWHADLQQHVRFIGYMDRERVLPSCYAAANVFVFASRTETQGLVLLEAMAMGVPVLALSAMGTADILEAEQGCIIAQDDVEDFALALSALLRDPVQQQRLSAQARHWAGEWSDQRMAERLIGLYQQVYATHHCLPLPLASQHFPHLSASLLATGDGLCSHQPVTENGA